MKSKIIATILCIAVLSASLWLLLKAPTDIKFLSKEQNTTVTDEIPNFENADVLFLFSTVILNNSSAFK